MSYYDLTIDRIPAGHAVVAINGELRCGCDVTPIDQQSLSGHREVDPDRSPVAICLTDNGIDGDGARLRVDFGDSLTGVVDLYIPDESLPVLYDAIGAILRLRSTQRSCTQTGRGGFPGIP